MLYNLNIREKNFVRTPWQVARSSVLALIIRNIQKRFITNVNSKRSLSFLWIFMEPMMHVAMWTAIRMVHGLASQNSMAMPLFILLGAIPWLFTRKVLSSSTNIISSNSGLLIFRQIRPIDFVIALLITELGIMILVFFIILFAFWWFNIDWHINDFLYWLVNLTSYVIFIAGFALILTVGGFFFKFVSKLMTVIMRGFYLFSGVFFNAHMIPITARKYFLLNPLFQIIEISRECFTPDPLHETLVDPIYLFKCAIVSLTLGMGIYITMRNKIMTEIEQR